MRAHAWQGPQAPSAGQLLGGRLWVVASGATMIFPMVCPNADSIAVWNEILVPKFKKFREVFVTAAATHSTPALDRFSPRVGDRALDLGCGFG